VKIGENEYRVYYVGESIDIKARMASHIKNRLAGKYTGHDIELLRENIRVLAHRADEGMTPKYSKIDRKSYNKRFLDELFIFYAPLALTHDKKADKWTRCRYETGIVMHIENNGQNILTVEHLRYSKEEKEHAQVNSGAAKIESLSGGTIAI
jgi:hypothetical protein